MWASRQQINVPENIRCDIGKEWRRSSEFSKNKLLDYQKRARGGPGNRATPGNSGIACRTHTAEPKLTHQCQGPCGKVFPHTNFSKNTRIRNVWWCIDCTEWQLANEPGFAPYPIPFSRETEEDKLPDKLPNTEVDLQDTAVPTQTAGPRLEPIAGGNTMWPVNFDDEDEALNNIEETEPVSSVNSAMLALTMASDAGTSEYGGSQSTITQSISARGASDGNHRGLGESDGTDTVSVSSRQTVHRGPIQEFNAWDRDGNFHRMRKAETVVSEARTTTTSKTTTATQSNGWAKTASRKNPPQPPAYLQAGKTATAGGFDTTHFRPQYLVGFPASRSDDGESDDDI